MSLSNLTPTPVLFLYTFLNYLHTWSLLSSPILRLPLFLSKYHQPPSGHFPPSSSILPHLTSFLMLQSEKLTLFRRAIAPSCYDRVLSKLASHGLTLVLTSAGRLCHLSFQSWIPMPWTSFSSFIMFSVPSQNFKGSVHTKIRGL